MTFLAPNAFISDSGPCVQPDEAAVSFPPGIASDTAAALSELLAIADARFKLDIPLFMSAIEDVPLFLRRAG